MNTGRKHFHTLNALRFFAFFLVFLHHTNFNESPIIKYISNSGRISVSFFFVLSGFLITYILLYEKTTTKTISLRNFFARRILRIWPLYYAMILLAYLTPHLLIFLNLPFSNYGYEPNWLVSVSFLENYKMMFSHNNPNVSPLGIMWSLCIEEHFYILWGLVLFFLPVKKMPLLIVLSIITANLSRFTYIRLGFAPSDIFSNIDYFAYGAIPAYIFIFRQDILRRIETIPLTIKYFILVSTIAIVFILPNISFSWLYMLSPFLLGILFSTVILFTLTPSNNIYINDSRILSRLGIYTYGLYLYHTIIINFLLQIRSSLPFEISLLATVILSFIISLLISIVSYHVFEKQFLKLKRYFYK